MASGLDNAVQELTVRVAVFEQVLLVLLARAASDYERPHDFAATVLAEVRERFPVQEGAGPASERFIHVSRQLVDFLETQALALLGPAPGDS